MDLCIGNMLMVGEQLCGLSETRVGSLYRNTPEETLGKLASLAIRSWYLGGAPRLVMGGRLAASLMCSDMPSDLANELRVPFETFVITVADEEFSIPVDGEEKQIANILCRVLKEGISVHAGGHDGLWFSALFPALVDLRELAQKSEWTSILASLLLGACAEATLFRESASMSTGRRSPPRDRRGKACCTDYCMTRQVTVDCRGAVRSYVRGGAASPEIRSLVRGHWKRQAFGPLGAQRKMVFIEPYFRGDEDAPTAFRPHVFSGDGAS